MPGNPLQSVGGATVKCPSYYQWSLEDLSADGAGRTEDTKMQKNRIGQVRKLELRWDSPTTSEVSAILTAFNPEYFNVTYLDAMSGAYRTSEFYAGNRASPLYNATMDRWENVSFNIIERSGV